MKAKRIGPRMRAVVAYVKANPGWPMFFAARYAAPKRNGHVGLRFGYASVHRAVDAGLVRGEPGPRGSTLLYPLGGTP